MKTTRYSPAFFPNPPVSPPPRVRFAHNRRTDRRTGRRTGRRAAAFAEHNAFATTGKDLIPIERRTPTRRFGLRNTL